LAFLAHLSLAFLVVLRVEVEVWVVDVVDLTVGTTPPGPPSRLVPIPALSSHFHVPHSIFSKLVVHVTHCRFHIKMLVPITHFHQRSFNFFIQVFLKSFPILEVDPRRPKSETCKKEKP